MTAYETLNQTWATVAGESSRQDGFYHRRIPMATHWPAHAGIRRPNDARLLMLEIESKALRDLRLKDETKGYAIDVIKSDTPAHASICIVETSPIFREIFVIFCSDILSHWCPQLESSNAVNALQSRLLRWKRFFQREGQGLCREDHIGLFGELTFLEQALNAGIKPLPLVDAWKASNSTNQDFLFGSVAVEIKTITSNDINRVRITNVRQLDSTGLDKLFLMRYAFDFRNGSGRTLPELVSSVKTMLGPSPDALALFNDRLLDAGFAETVPNEFDTWGFTQRQAEVFMVLDGFPRLLESALPSGVSEVAYTLDLSSANGFRTVVTNIWSSGI